MGDSLLVSIKKPQEANNLPPIAICGRNSSMAPQQDLVKIGLEGFDLIDTLYGPPTRRSNNGGFITRQRQGNRGVQPTYGYGYGYDHNKEEPVINSNEAAYIYGGFMVVDYPKTNKPQNRWGKMFRAFKL